MQTQSQTTIKPPQNLYEYLQFVQEATHPGVGATDFAHYYHLGWLGEMGECQQLLSKALRQVASDRPLPQELWDKLILELGDVLFYWVAYRSVTPDGLAGYEWEQFADNIQIIHRGSPITVLHCDLFYPLIDYAPIILPYGMSFEDLALSNWAKLQTTKQQTGSFAKGVA